MAVDTLAARGKTARLGSQRIGIVLEEADQRRLEEHVKMFLLHDRCLNLEAAICCSMHEPIICGGQNPSDILAHSIVRPKDFPIYMDNFSFFGFYVFVDKYLH